MEYTAEVYNALCSLRNFEINGNDADIEDFVDKYDHAPDSGIDGGCGAMRADTKPATDIILKKYGITRDEYYTVASDVAAKVSFGDCGWCI